VAAPASMSSMNEWQEQGGGQRTGNDRFWVILGAARESAHVQRSSAARARVMASVGSTTTRLVISEDQPFGRFVTAHAKYPRAVTLREGGASIDIVTEPKISSHLQLVETGD
jgi:DNA polymerase-3 subunit epsilon